MDGDFFGGFDFNGDGHISNFERAMTFDIIDSVGREHSGSAARYSGSGSCIRLGSYGGSTKKRSKLSSRAYTGTHRPGFCNIYGGYYACRKDKA